MLACQIRIIVTRPSSRHLSLYFLSNYSDFEKGVKFAWLEECGLDIKSRRRGECNEWQHTNLPHVDLQG